MPRSPSPDDALRLEKFYIDETSQTGHRNFIIGGIVFPARLAEQFEKDILQARPPRLAAERPGRSEPYEMKWSEVDRVGFEAYRPIIDAYFDFADKHINPGEGTVEFHCRVVLTQVRGRTFSGKRGRVPFNKEMAQHCLKVAIYHKSALFHIHPDRRHSDDAQSAEVDLSFRKRLRGLLKLAGDTRETAIRRVELLHSHNVQALQVADLLIGAVAFRLNRHYNSETANPDKVRLCEYILQRGKAWSCFDSEAGTYIEKTTGRFHITQARPAEAKRNPPARRKAPATLASLMREKKQLSLSCTNCGREREVDPSSLPAPATTLLRDVVQRMRCTACGALKVKLKS